VFEISINYIPVILLFCGISLLFMWGSQRFSGTRSILKKIKGKNYRFRWHKLSISQKIFSIIQMYLAVTVMVCIILLPHYFSLIEEPKQLTPTLLFIVQYMALLIMFGLLETTRKE
jgi:hypothetical protein